MTAEAIAKVVTDLRTGRVRLGSLAGQGYERFPNVAEGIARSREAHTKVIETSAGIAATSPVVDVTAVFNQIMADNKRADLYGDHKAAPPWWDALLAYTNTFGNVYVIQIIAADAEWRPDHQDPIRWKSENPMDWDRVKWVLDGQLFLGGRNGGGDPVPTTGPIYAWDLAVYADGEIADIRWTDMGTSQEVDRHTNAMLVLLKTLDLANCVNVQICEPDRPRHQARRLARTGVAISEIHVKPISKSYKGKGTPMSADVPLHQVRGHFATYGEGGRGKLFGRLTGRYFIPAHVRGSREHGQVEQTYIVEP